MMLQDCICCDAQTMLRILCHGGINTLLGNDSKQVNLTVEISIWDSIVVTPLEKAVYAEGENEETENAGVKMEMDLPDLVKQEATA